MKNIKKFLHYTVLALFAMMFVSVAPPVADTANAASCSQRSILTFPTWYKGLSTEVRDGKCIVSDFKLNDFWVIVMNGIEILLQAVAYAAVGYIVWGGFKYIKSEGDPAKISEAKSAIINAITGLVIALASVAIVQFIQGRIS